jgi:hypothetical protein
MSGSEENLERLSMTSATSATSATTATTEHTQSGGLASNSGYDGYDEAYESEIWTPWSSHATAAVTISVDGMPINVAFTKVRRQLEFIKGHQKVDEERFEKIRTDVGLCVTKLDSTRLILSSRLDTAEKELQKMLEFGAPGGGMSPEQIVMLERMARDIKNISKEQVTLSNTTDEKIAKCVERVENVAEEIHTFKPYVELSVDQLRLKMSEKFDTHLANHEARITALENESKEHRLHAEEISRTFRY